MTKTLANLINKMTLQERKEVETFAAFIISRRNFDKDYLVTNDVPVNELIEVISDSGSFNWLNNEEEDIYSLNDGEEVQWAI
jgi:hypothetical protein